MASSGTYRSTISSPGYVLEMRWSTVSQDIANNRSSVKVELWIVCDYYINSTATKTASITINGSTGTYSFVIGKNSSGVTKKIAERTVAVPHNSDGTKTVALSAYADVQVTLNGSYVNRASVSGSPTLDTIPRASSFSSAPNSVAANSSWSYGIARASSKFTHDIKFTFGGNTSTQTGVGTSGTFTVPLSWLNAIPNSTSGTMTVLLTTKNGTTTIGSRSYSVTVSAPSTVVPTLSGITATRVNNSVPSAWAKYVQNESQATITFNSPAGVYGSTIKSYSVKMGTTSKSGSSVKFDLPSSGTITFTGTVTDSRGRSTSKTTSITVEPYSPPQITSSDFYRAASTGDFNQDGTHGAAKIDYDYSTVGGSNTVTTLVEYKQTTESTWISGGSFTDNSVAVFGSGDIDTNNEYNVRAKIVDGLGNTVWATYTLSTAFVTMDILAEGKGVSFGKVASQAGVLESDFIGQFNNGFNSPRIPADADLNDYVHTGFFYSPADADVATFINSPPDRSAGALVVLDSAGTQQFWHSYNNNLSAGGAWRRRYYSGSWSQWEPINRIVKATATLLNGWTNYRGAYELAGYTLDRANRVHLTGLVRDGTIGSPIMTLPPQCRPAGSLIFACPSWNNGYVQALVYVTPDGNVTPDSIGGTNWLSLAGISFDAVY